MAFHNHSRNNIVLKHGKDVKCTTCLLTEWTQKASGLFRADDMFLIERVPVLEQKILRFVWRERLE